MVIFRFDRRRADLVHISEVTVITHEHSYMCLYTQQPNMHTKGQKIKCFHKHIHANTMISFTIQADCNLFLGACTPLHGRAISPAAAIDACHLQLEQRGRSVGVSGHVSNVWSSSCDDVTRATAGTMRSRCGSEHCSGTLAVWGTHASARWYTVRQ